MISNSSIRPMSLIQALSILKPSECSCVALALKPPIASQFTSEVILEKTNDSDTIHNLRREKHAQQKDFKSSAPTTDNSRQSDEELIEIRDNKMNSSQLIVAYGERSRKIFIFDNVDTVSEIRDSDFYNQLGQQIGMSQFLFEHLQDGYDWLASIKQEGKNFIERNDSTTTSLHGMSLSKIIYAQFIDAVMSKDKL
ncbi:MAG: hypothetical protein EZS28_033450 [Streblomastix strix]|uniref:Uncharacterized protein n=1 Tax=Streblomastix strix TaxID=222440 RepID=A0A5J4UL72_9EUKA|nr:MAG: hypothetical protein EZS28_033450 [Streblomastix strix]